MPELPSAADLSGLASLLAPGFVILGTRARYRAAATQPIAERVLGYAVLSITYNGIAYPIFHTSGGVELVGWLWQLCFSILFPVAVAIALIVFDQSDWFYSLSAKLGLTPVHHIQTAWDRTFRNRKPSYVLVHLSDGSTVAGAWTDGSFASSIASERDLLISQLWKLDGERWSKVDPPRAMLISGGIIRMVEFIAGG